MTEGDSDRRPRSRIGRLAAAVHTALFWHALPAATHAYRRVRNYAQGNYSPATIAVEWPSSPLRTDFLNEVITRIGARAYLEIGCRDDECFSQIRAPYRVGVDPAAGGTVRATSDAFFSDNSERFDVIFIDGLHLYEQVLRDIRNSLDALNPNGVIVLHDCVPTNCVSQYREQASREWNGDVWKAVVEARTWPHVDTATCMIDQGLGIIRARPNSAPLALPEESAANLTYEFLAADYQRLMRAIDYESGLRFATRDGAP